MELNPLTLTRRAAGLALDTTLGLASRALRLVTGSEDERPQPLRREEPRATASPLRREEPQGRGEPPRPAAPPPAAAPPPVAAAPPQPDEIVATSSDTDDDVGPNLRVDEPWPDYAHMNAADVVDRLVVADAATLAAVELYERTHRDRATVVDAARKQLARR